ncbi:LysR family substrate-binding domain-containing protein [Amycolatopsis sp. FDAARGOS 1241]|uniref:LysR family substrate-binding domain-containing protein n=1 Tax=Amycolatopsis sp. FDAARGOS 1241 TaxID=2778070 RepID=UPI001EF31986|nr:LysR family substrate-binding domain-containing protein [Amycolatopsis sp. FDAARGOS 1241]
MVRVLRREPLIAALPASHPLTARRTVRLADLRDEPFICYPARHRSVVYDTVFDVCQQAGLVPSVAQEVGETATPVSFVAGGLGVALVPASVRHLKVTGSQFRPLAGTTREVQLAVAVRTGEDSPHVAKVLSRTHTLVGGPR